MPSLSELFPRGGVLFIFRDFPSRSECSDLDFGIALNIQLARISSSSALVLSRDSIERELRDELKDCSASSWRLLAPLASCLLSSAPVEDPELPDLPTAEGRGR